MTKDNTAQVPHPALTPTSLSQLELRNRLAVAPMSRVSTAGDGVPTAAMRHYYTSFAEGGFGLIVTEGTYTDLAFSQAYRNQAGIATEEQAAGWRSVVGAVHAAGAKVFLQLMHAGALSQENTHRAETIGPSVIAPKGLKMSDYGGAGPFATPRAMSHDDIRHVVAGFAAAAGRARDVGFDGVEIHGANGYLLDQFLTTYTNTRTDEYGGAIANRIRLTSEVVSAIVRALGDTRPDFVVGVRLSQMKVNDVSYRWPGGADDAQLTFTTLRAVGAEFLHIAGEGGEWLETSRLPNGETITGLARRVTGLPVFANGGLDDPAKLAYVLHEGHADLVTIGRGALANPDWPRRLALGVPFEPFDGSMLQPSASLENVARWRAARLAAATETSQ